MSDVAPRSGFGRRARAVLHEAGRGSSAFADLLLSSAPREAYVQLMIEQHHHMSHGGRFMHLACDGIRAAPALAPYRFVADYFERHIEEEAGHDDMLVEDLEALGVSRRKILEHRPSAAVGAMIGRQDRLLDAGFPLDLLGYAYALEGIPPTEESIRHLQDWLDLPDDGVRTLRFHAQVDIEHAAELEDILDRITDSSLQERISNNIRATCRDFVEVIRTSVVTAGRGEPAVSIG